MDGTLERTKSPYSEGVVSETEGSVEIYIGPKAPWQKIRLDTNSLRVPMLRIYGPLEPWKLRRGN
jgi:hypothetical protein